MKWFDRWVVNKYQQLANKQITNGIGIPSDIVAVEENRINSQGMTFNVYRANGGFVVENRVYDKRTDRINNGLHIVTEDKNLGEELGKIITFESLRN